MPGVFKPSKKRKIGTNLTVSESRNARTGATRKTTSYKNGNVRVSISQNGKVTKRKIT